MKKITVLLILLMGFFVISCGKGSSADSGEWVAKFEGGKTISMDEFEKSFDILLKLRFSKGRGALLKEDPVIRRRILDTIIAQKLIITELEKTKIVKPAFIKVFELQGLTQYFTQQKVLPKIDVPSDEWIQARYENKKLKAELVKRGIKTYAAAKRVLVGEYQKAMYVRALQSAMKALKFKYKIKINDDFEDGGVEKYVKNQLKPEEYAKTWLLKIENKSYTAQDMENFIKAMVEINYGKAGGAQYAKSNSAKSRFRQQMINDYLGALLVYTEAQKENWLSKADVKDFIQVFVNNAKTKLYLERKIAPTVKKPGEAELKAFYQRFKKQIKAPYGKVKDQLLARIYSRKVQSKMAAYMEKIIRENKVAINEKLFKPAKKEEKNTEKKANQK